MQGASHIDKWWLHQTLCELLEVYIEDSQKSLSKTGTQMHVKQPVQRSIHCNRHEHCGRRAREAQDSSKSDLLSQRTDTERG